MEGAERLRFFRVNRALLKQQNRMERLDAATGPTVEALGIIAGMLAAAAAGYLVFVGLSWGDFFYRMDRDQFLTWMVALFAMFDPVRKLAKVSMRFQQAEAAAKRIFELHDTPHEPHGRGAPALPRHRQEHRVPRRQLPLPLGRRGRRQARQPAHPGRADRRHRRAQRQRQDHAGQPGAAPADPDLGIRCSSTGSTSPASR